MKRKKKSHLVRTLNDIIKLRLVYKLVAFSV